MVFKLVTAAAKTWRRLKGENQLPKVAPVHEPPRVTRSLRAALFATA
jgi:hypothetical protein